MTSPTSPPQPSPSQPTPSDEPESRTPASRRPAPGRAVVWGGALVSAVVGLGLLTRYGIHGSLGRDEAIYTYSGQQFAHGVAPYASMFDPKGPLASMLAGAAAFAADTLGRNDLYAIRALYLLFSVGAVVGIYLLAVRVFGSVAGGVAAAVTMASFRGFAADALAGPDAKTPGVLLVVVAMLLMTRRRWAWAAFAGSLAFLVWQPFVFYPAIAVLLAAVFERRNRPVRAVAGTVAAAALPVVAVAAYFAAVGALDKLVEAALVFPLTGIKRSGETVLDRIAVITRVVHDYYQLSGVLLWVGLASLALLIVVHLVRREGGLRVALAHPLVAVVGLTGLSEVAYALSDFQGYQDVYPLLPYGALGIGGLAALLAGLVPGTPGRRAVEVVVVVLAAVLATVSWVRFTEDPGSGSQFDHRGLNAQLADACALRRVAGHHGKVLALGDGAPLVLTHRRNADRFIYLNSGVDRWKIAHTPGGFAGWTRQIERLHPTVIVMHGWSGTVQMAMGKWLRDEGGYQRRYLGRWRVFLDDAAMARARQVDVRLATMSSEVATDRMGHPLPSYTCG